VVVVVVEEEGVVGRHGRRGPLVAGVVVRADTGGQQAGKRR
jgi:hypothetical protein